MIIDALQCKFPPQDPTTREMAKTRYTTQKRVGAGLFRRESQESFSGS
jgi:hypothetical protein